jgi:soluble lytic murein transglycosylase
MMPAVFSGPRLAGAGLALLTLACSLASASVPTATLEPAATPTPTALPSPSPTRSEPIDAGRQALFNGDWDQAYVEFSGQLEQAGGPEQIAGALYGRGEALLRSGLYAGAQVEFSELIERFPTSERSAQARLLRAQALLGQGQSGQSATDYAAYLEQRPGVLDAYVEEWLADALRLAGQPLEAVAHYQNAIAAPRITDALPLLVKIGRCYLEAGELDLALTQFDSISAQTTDPGTRASMNLLAGESLEGLGDFEGAVSRYIDSVTNYPTAYDSYIALVRLVEAGIPVDEFQRGLVDYHAGAYEPALAAFDRVLGSVSSSAGFYYRGLSHLALGNSQQALADFEWVVTNFPEEALWPEAALAKARTEWAYLDQYSAAVDTYLALAAARPEPGIGPEALFAAGRTAERGADLQQAAEIWLRLTEQYPAEDLAHQGAFLSGVARFRLGQFTEADLAFKSALASAITSADEASAELWIGKTQQAGGDPQAAEAAWNRAVEADPTGYYSVRAAELLVGRPVFEGSGAFDFTFDQVAERFEAEQWLRQTFSLLGPDPLSEPNLAIAGDLRYVRGRELWALGEVELAAAEFSSLRQSVESDPEATYRLMHELLSLGLYREAIFASRQILRLAGLDDAATLNAPVYFNRIRFGPYFGELILPEAARYGLDGLFLLSVVRQESLFEGFATSSAAAHGLMQVIPSTGESIAAQLGWPPDYSSADLHRPIVSVRFGTYYLATQRDRFEGDLFAALAAYNAGPGNAQFWKELAPSDPDLFLEVIRLDQPQLYIRVIFEVYEIYRNLYSAG